MAIDCVGVPETIGQALTIVRRGGHVQLVGMAADNIEQFAVFAILGKELSLRGTFRYANCYPVALGLAAAGLARVAPLITHRFALDQVASAMDFVAANKDQVIKAIIQPA